MRVLQREAQVQLDIKRRHSDVVGAQRALGAVHARRQDHGTCARAARRTPTGVAQRAAYAEPGYSECA